MTPSDDTTSGVVSKEVAATLSRPIVAILGTTSKAGEPHLTAVWYVYSEGRFLIVTPESSAKVAHIRANPTVELCINAGPVGPCITAHGVATIVGPMTLDLLVTLAERYLGPVAGAKYVAARNPDASSVIVSVEPRRWREWSAADQFTRDSDSVVQSHGHQEADGGPK